MVLVSPIMVVVAVAVRIFLGAPVCFRQRRPGLHSEVFEILKFRSMNNETDEQGELLPDEERLTTFGRFLRSTSLDELPGLLNVLRGEMSLVGPRPLLVDYLPLYSERHARRHDAKPGVTGWASVMGRNAITWEERLELDVWYVENRSFWLDLKILLMTVPAVLSRRGASPEGLATMERFRGLQVEDTTNV